MLQSFTDKIHTKRGPYVWGCPCCMTRHDKPMLRRLKRRKLDEITKEEIKNLNKE